MAPGSLRDRRLARPIRAAAALGLCTVLLGTLSAPVDAAPKYPSKDEVSEAKQDADESARAAAAMREKLAAARARLNRLDTKVEIAVEAYNGAVYRLKKAKTAYSSAKKRAVAGAAAVEDARSGVAAVASSAYTGSGVRSYSSLFSSGEPAELADRASMLNALSAQHAGAFDRLKAAKVVQEIVRKQAKTALSKQRVETKRVAATKKAAQNELAAQQQVLGKVAALESKLADRAARDAREATTTVQERRAGVAEARRIAAEKAAAEARKRAAEARKRANAAAKQNGNHGASDETSGGGQPNASPQSHGGSGGKAAVRFARKQIGKWYEWAADGPDTFDCSGLTMRAWQHGGESLPHYSVAQWEQTRRVSLSNLRKGDLVFYADNTSNPSTIHHVGIFIGGSRMIEAPHTGAQVRIASIYRSGLIGAGRP